MTITRTFFRRAGVAVGWVAAWLAGVWAGGGSASDFGFSGPEIFPVDTQISLLKAADVDGDGRTDLLVVNNRRSLITVLRNRTGDPPAAEPGEAREINDLPPDARFEIRTVAAEKRIDSLVVADLNGDTRPDLAYYGTPRELVVQWNRGPEGWGEIRRWPLADGLGNAGALAAGDFNGDGRQDLILLAEEHFYVLEQRADGGLGEPVRTPYSDPADVMHVLDIDGDRLDDLMLVRWESTHPIRVKRQRAGGGFGPEILFERPPIRAFWADDLDRDGAPEVLTILRQSGRVEASHFRREPGEPLAGGFRAGAFEVHAFSRTSKARRGMAWGDVDGDGRSDLVVAEPENGRLLVALQDPDGDLERPRPFPTLSGIQDVVMADWDRDGRTDVFLFSADERVVGRTVWDEAGRLPFPEILPVSGRPLAVAVGPKVPGGVPVLWVVADRDGRRRLELHGAEGVELTRDLDAGFDANPASATVHDVDQDGRNDLVILSPYEKVKMLVQRAEGDFDEVDLAAPGGDSAQPWLGRADLDRDGHAELLLPQNNFLRAVVLRRRNGTREGEIRWTFDVTEQINGASRDSKIVGMTTVAGEPRGPLFLLDAERKALAVCAPDEAGVWQVVREEPMPLQDLAGLESVRLGGRPHLVFTGRNKVALLDLDGDRWALEPMRGYETPVRDGVLRDLVSGDLNADGLRDLVFLEVAQNHVDLVTYEPGEGLEPGNRWQVFEGRTFRNRQMDASEPREALVADVTGDGLEDLVLLVHDRVLVYPQESGGGE